MEIRKRGHILAQVVYYYYYFIIIIIIIIYILSDMMQDAYVAMQVSGL